MVAGRLVLEAGKNREVTLMTRCSCPFSLPCDKIGLVASGFSVRSGLRLPPWRSPVWDRRVAPEHHREPMPRSPDKDTSLTLIMRVQQDPADPQAWDQFVERITRSSGHGV